jgi:hypothetical protein
LATPAQDTLAAAPGAQAEPAWSALLPAGLATGVLAASVAILYYALDGMLRGDGPWRYLNLQAAGLFGRRALTESFSTITLAGMSLYIVMSAAVGALAVWPLAKLRNRSYWRRALGLAIGLAWYYLSFRLLWREWNPALVVRQPFPGALIGHLVYGFCLGLLPRALEDASLARRARE